MYHSDVAFRLPAPAFDPSPRHFLPCGDMAGLADGAQFRPQPDPMSARRRSQEVPDLPGSCRTVRGRREYVMDKEYLSLYRRGYRVCDIATFFGVCRRRVYDGIERAKRVASQVEAQPSEVTR